MTIDLIGIAAVIVAFGTPLTIIFTQYNTRKAIRDAEAARVKDAAETKGTLDAQNKVLAVVALNVNGNLSETKKIADAFQTEIERVSAGGAPTPYGEPSEARPVTLSAGKATTARPERAEPEK